MCNFILCMWVHVLVESSRSHALVYFSSCFLRWSLEVLRLIQFRLAGLQTSGICLSLLPPLWG